MKNSFVVAVLCSVALAYAHAQPQGTISPDSFDISGSSAVPGTVAIDLDGALARALKDNPSIRQAEAAVDAAEARVRQKQSGYYPLIDAEAKYTRLDPDPAIAFPPFGTIQFFPANNYDAHLGLYQTVYDFGKTSSIVAVSRSGREAAKYGLELTKTDIAFRAIRSFYTVLLLEQSMLVQDQQISSLDEYFSIVKKKVASGTATNFDALTIEVKLSEEKNQKFDIANALEKQKIALKRLLGIKDDSDIELKGEFSDEPVALDETGLISGARAGRPELKIAAENEAAAAEKLRVAKTDGNPSINVGFMYGEKNGYFFDLSEMRKNTVGFVQADMQLFNGFKSSNMVREADANLSSAKENSRDAEDSVTEEIRQSISDVRADMEKIDAYKLHVRLAEQAVEQAKVRYENGIITNLDLLNAQTSLAQANLLYLQSLYNYEMSRVSLRKAAGLPLVEVK